MRTSYNDGNITIRPFEPKDVLSFLATVKASSHALGKWMSWCHADYSLREAEEWLASCQAAWAQESSYPFLIVEPASHEVIGSVDINQINREHNFGNIGYWVSSAHTGKGIATTAAKWIVQLGFDEIGLTRLEIVALPENAASRRVAEKVGATFECIARNRLFAWGKPHDAAVYSITPEAAS